MMGPCGRRPYLVAVHYLTHTPFVAHMAAH
jgi:hypothetical protein